MADTVYVIDDLSQAGTTVTVTDDGSGSDWLVFSGQYAATTQIRLTWTANSGGSTDATGTYLMSGVWNRLVVNGLIENARGSIGADAIAGNEVANILYGDARSKGPGLADTLDGNGGDDRIFGGSGGDSITGDSGNDAIRGDSGNDSISGGDGNDTIEGGSGADDLSGGGSAGDTLSYRSSSNAVLIEISHGATTFGRFGDAEGDRISGFRNMIGSDNGDSLTDAIKTTLAFGYNENLFDGGRGTDVLRMGGGDDTALGGEGNDTLLGENGRDQLLGGAGSDQLWGGRGRDIFVFRQADDSGATAETRDTLHDLHHDQRDQIDLRGVDANLATATIDALSFGGLDAEGVNPSGQVVYHAIAGGLLLTANLDGDAGIEFSIFLLGLTTLVEGDLRL